MTVAPLIYVRTQPAPPMSAWQRVLAAGIALAGLSVLMIAVRLEPAAGGLGTHLQLGMQPCGFYQTTGIPCAACGMTTSFAHLVRGQVLASLYAQPFGCVLALLTAVAVSIGAYIAITGRPAHAPIAAVPIKTHLWIWLPMAAAAWGWKILIVLSHH